MMMLSGGNSGIKGKAVQVDIGPFSKIPNRFFSSGTASRLGTSASLLLLALFEHANRHSSTTFKASDKALASETTLAPRTISDARKRLMEHGHILFTREPGKSYSYSLLKQEMKWKPLKDRLRRKLRPRALHAPPSA
jgi:hypothetical protein